MMSLNDTSSQPPIYCVSKIEGLSGDDSPPKDSKPRTQTLLSCSESRGLTVVHPFMMSEGDAETTSYETRSNKPFLYSINSTLPSDDEAYIFRLPNELLQKCLQFLINGDAASNAEMKPPCERGSFSPHIKSRISSRSIWAASVTCKTFSQLSKPLLYTDLIVLAPSFLDVDEHIVELDANARRRLRHFYRSTKESPELVRFCKIVAAHFKQSTWLECQAALRQTSSLQELTLVGSDIRFERLGNVFGALRCLKVLTLSGVQCHEPHAGHASPAIQKQRAAADRAALPLPVSRKFSKYRRG